MTLAAGQTATDEVVEQPDQLRLTFSAATLVILLLVAVSLGLRLAQLGAVPMTPTEAPEALAAWRSISSQSPGVSETAGSAVVFWVQRLAFAFLGDSELAARVLTAAAGVVLGLAPLLFSRYFGLGRALVMAVLLTLSPVALVASRFTAESVWTMLLVIVGLWALWRYAESQERGYVMASGVLFSMAGLLTGASGIVVSLTMLIAGMLTVLIGAFSAPDDADVPGDEYIAQVWHWLVSIPWMLVLASGGLAAVAVATGFLLYPAGLGMVGEAISRSIGGLISSTHPFDPLFFPLLTSVFYDPWLWLVALVSILLMIRRGQVDLVERFLMAWLFVAAFVSLVYQGGQAVDALWTVVPLVGLASYALAAAFDSEPDWYWDGEWDDVGLLDRPGVLKWIFVAVTAVLMVMFAVHFQMIARGFLSIPGGTLGGFVDQINEQAFNRFANSVVWFFIAALLLSVGYFLVASVWGRHLSGHALLLGVAVFAIAANTGSGWRTAVERADNPIEPWHTVATDPDVRTLRETLHDLAFREMKGFPGLPVVVMADDNGVLAWQLRDFSGVRFIDGPAEAWQEQIAILPFEVGEAPELGGSYVGQRIQLARTWSSGALQGFDFLAWWALQQTRFGVEPVAYKSYILWVRQDIYDGQRFDASAG